MRKLFFAMLFLLAAFPAYSQDAADVPALENDRGGSFLEKMKLIGNALSDLIVAADERDEAAVVEISLRLRRAYHDLKDSLTQSVEKTYDSISAEIVERLSVTPEDPSAMYTFFSQFLDEDSPVKGNPIERRDYELQIISCTPSVYHKDIRLALYIFMKNGYRIVRSFEGEAPIPLHTDFSLSLNVAEAELHYATPRPYAVGGKKVLGYDNPFYFPLPVKVSDVSQPLDLVANVEFTACHEESGLCRTFKERAGIFLHPGRETLESGFCQRIRNYYSARTDERFSLAKIKDVFYAVHNGELCLFVSAEFPNYAYDAFMAVENPYGAKFDVSIAKQSWGKITFIASSEDIDEEFITKPLTVIVGERNFSSAKEITPRFDREYRYDLYPSGFPLIRTAFAILLVLYGAVWYAKFKKLPFYNIRLLRGLSYLVGGAAGLVLAAFLILTAVQHDNYLNDGKEIETALADGKSVYVNATTTLCITCKYNDFLFNNLMYTKNLINDGKIVSFKADMNIPEHRSILNRYGISRVPGGILITPKAKYGIPLPPVLSESDLGQIVGKALP